MASSPSRSDRPLTCQRPVRPGVTSDRRLASLGIWASSDARCGRGPTSDIEPAKHVEELRQLIEGEVAQELAEAGDPRVIA